MVRTTGPGGAFPPRSQVWGSASSWAYSWTPSMTLEGANLEKGVSRRMESSSVFHNPLFKHGQVCVSIEPHEGDTLCYLPIKQGGNLVF